MLEEILAYLNNWFVDEIYTDTYTIADGDITLPFLQQGQYFRIIGSVFNDGVYQYGEALELTDETFTGTIWALAIPRNFLALVDEITSWQEKYGDAVSGPYASESFGGYSYTKASGDGSESGWIAAFKTRLAPYRKLRNTAGVQGDAHQDPPYHRPFNPDFPWWG